MKTLISFFISFLFCTFAIEAQTISDSGYRTVGHRKDDGTIQNEYNTPRFSDRHNYGGMTRNRYICKKEENHNGKTI